MAMYTKSLQKFAKVYHKLGIVEDELGNYRKSVDIFLHILEIKKKLFGENSLEASGEYSDITKSLEHLANAYIRKGDLEKADGYLDSATFYAITTDYNRILSTE
jgi:tetratricopeptide (TPR) repeat protein